MKSPENRNVLRLGFVSLLNDLGSELLVRLIPLYVSGVLGAPMSAVGAIEGVAESTATLLKPVFGAVSDRAGRRKAFVVAGYGFSALSRPFLALARSWPWVAVLRFTDRLGKGVRTAPRDALIADSSIGRRHGRSFGINRALDTVGALAGVALFGAWTWLRGERELTSATWVGLCVACSLPGLLATALAGWGVDEIAPPPAASEAASRTSLHPAARPGGRLSGTLKRYLVVVGVFSLANSSDAFILLRARELGFTLPGILGVVALFNLVSAMTALPAAALSDRAGRRSLIAMGWVIYAVAYALFGAPFSSNPVVFASVVAIYGLFYGFTDGVERAWVADLAPSEQRGRAYGIFGLVVGVIALPASAAFGWAWDRFGSALPFLASSAIAVMATLLLFVWVPTSRPEAAGAPYSS
jgi:MFS family permease